MSLYFLQMIYLIIGHTWLCAIMDSQMSLNDLVTLKGSLIKMKWDSLVDMFLPLEEVQFNRSLSIKIAFLGLLWRLSLYPKRRQALRLSSLEIF